MRSHFLALWTDIKTIVKPWPVKSIFQDPGQHQFGDDGLIWLRKLIHIGHTVS